MNSVLAEDLQYIARHFEPREDLFDRTYLVTGATGLVGSVLIKSLLVMADTYGRSLKVVAVVRDEKKAKEIYGELAGHPALTFYCGDLLSADFAKAFEENSPVETLDYIVHGASITTSKTMVERPVDTVQTAYVGTTHMLELARTYQVKKMIYISSMEVYGTMSGSGKTTEDMLGYVNLADARSCYPEGKRICECLCNSYAKQYGLPVCSARLAQTFGAGVLRQENRVFAQFARSAMRGEPIVLHTKGLSEGNYCYTADMVEALFLLLLKGKAGEAYNVANESCHTTIADMAKMVCREFSQGKSEVVFDIPEDMGTYGYAPDTKLFLSSEKLRSLGWEARVGLKEAYGRLIAYLAEEES